MFVTTSSSSRLITIEDAISVSPIKYYTNTFRSKATTFSTVHLRSSYIEYSYTTSRIILLINYDFFQQADYRRRRHQRESYNILHKYNSSWSHDPPTVNLHVLFAHSLATNRMRSFIYYTLIQPPHHHRRRHQRELHSMYTQLMIVCPRETPPRIGWTRCPGGLTHSRPHHRRHGKHRPTARRPHSNGLCSPPKEGPGPGSQLHATARLHPRSQYRILLFNSRILTGSN